MAQYKDAGELMDANFTGLNNNRAAPLENTEINILIERAYDIRKFEIDLYWKRAVYFWGFIVASFTALFIVCDNSKHYSPYLRLIVCSIGFIFSLSWYLINRGSKFWQENWEGVIDMLESRTNRPLYRINLLKDSPTPFNEPFSRYPYSVSRINIIVSLFVCAIWLCLFIHVLYPYLKNIGDCKSTIDWNALLIAVITVGATLLLFIAGVTSDIERRDNAHFHLGIRE
jgi:hypothetical protein